ncbi:hypothetical protein [Paludisphaera borealis]|uniref:Uncharacterized protein n=1 Tax=Paludisphaera borealis TaxID=1387353 RepID=A0A1U7CX66_9BACT|nr:hypothetical protein [Paludisphaera borealis]APW63511.1 hypothetical protein BSF38_05083 [Paludisphaera borealis]
MSGKQNELVFAYPDLMDHYCTKGDPPCPDRDPSPGFYDGPTPRDAAIQCRKCRWAAHCFSNDGFGGSDLDVEAVDDDCEAEQPERGDWVIDRDEYERGEGGAPGWDGRELGLEDFEDEIQEHHDWVNETYNDYGPRWVWDDLEMERMGTFSVDDVDELLDSMGS